MVVDTEYPGSRWEQSTGEDLDRRSLYTFWKRTVTHPAMLTFDAPDREFCTVRRSRTNTPLQALLLWNEPGYLEAARPLALLRLDGRGGIKPGISYGATDDFGFNVVEQPVHIHDLQATILHCLGIDHTRLTYRFQGRQFRLTDVHGEVVKAILT